MFVLNLKMCVRVQHCSRSLSPSFRPALPLSPAVRNSNANQQATTPAPQGSLRNRWQLIRGAVVVAVALAVAVADHNRRS